jgi:hypothetical protein
MARNTRHNDIEDAIKTLCTKAQVSAIKQPLFNHGTNQRADLLITMDSQLIFVDTTVVDSTAGKWNTCAIRGPGMELEEAARIKKVKYERHVREFGNNATFIAAACSIYGGVSKEFNDLVKTIAEQGYLHTNGLYKSSGQEYPGTSTEAMKL